MIAPRKPRKPRTTLSLILARANIDGRGGTAACGLGAG